MAENQLGMKASMPFAHWFAADLAGGAKPSVRKEEAKPTVELEVKNVLASTPAELALLQKSAHEAGPIVTWHNERFFPLGLVFF